jgi:hypothetical protein
VSPDTTRDGSDFVGYYSTKWRGWTDYMDPCPLIRGDIAFAGWEPVTVVEVVQLNQAARRELVEAIDKEAAVVIKPRSAIVTTRNPRPRRRW